MEWFCESEDPLVVDLRIGNCCHVKSSRILNVNEPFYSRDSSDIYWFMDGNSYEEECPEELQHCLCKDSLSSCQSKQAVLSGESFRNLYLAGWHCKQNADFVPSQTPKRLSRLPLYLMRTQTIYNYLRIEGEPTPP